MSPASSGPLFQDLDGPYDSPQPDDGPSPDQFGIVHANDRPYRAGLGLLMLGLGFAFLIFGGALVIARTLIVQSGHTFNEACSVLPGCRPGTDLTIGLDTVGFLLIAFGLLLVFLGYRRSMGRRAWDIVVDDDV